MSDTFYSSANAKEEILNIYHEKLDELKIEYEFVKAQTSFGETNVISTGNSQKPPIILIHGSNGCAPIALEAMMLLLEHFKVYAIDIVGQPNLSAETRPNLKDTSYGKWVNEILEKLNLNEVIIAGASFGGFICLKTLVTDETRIKKTFLIVPAGIVDGNPLKAIFKIFIPMKLYMWTKNTKYLRSFLETLFTEEDTFALNFLSKVFLHFKMDFTLIPKISDEEANNIKTPVYVVGADTDVFFPGIKMIERSKKIFRTMPETLLLENTKHVPNKAVNKKIASFIIENSFE